MGQYYRVLTQEKGKEAEAFNRDIVVNGKTEYTMAKLMEHSWMENYFVNAICHKIYTAATPVQVAWIGDYAEGVNFINGLDGSEIDELYKKCWDGKSKSIDYVEFSMKDKYLVNHTKRQFIDCAWYYQNNNFDGGWCIHPLPLLTCIGNGLGSGDYNFPTEDSSVELVGSWAWDDIGVVDNPVAGYEEIFPIFKER